MSYFLSMVGWVQYPRHFPCLVEILLLFLACVISNFDISQVGILRSLVATVCITIGCPGVSYHADFAGPCTRVRNPGTLGIISAISV